MPDESLYTYEMPRELSRYVPGKLSPHPGALACNPWHALALRNCELGPSRRTPVIPARHGVEQHPFLHSQLMAGMPRHAHQEGLVMHLAPWAFKVLHRLPQVYIPARIQPVTGGASGQDCDAACEEVHHRHDLQIPQCLPYAEGLRRDPGPSCASSPFLLKSGFSPVCLL